MFEILDFLAGIILYGGFLDAIERSLKPGTKVRKCQPHGCPKNGTLKHCYICDAITEKFYGLVHESSLED